MNKPLTDIIPPPLPTENVEPYGTLFLATDVLGDTKYAFVGETPEQALRLLRQHLMRARRRLPDGLQ
jgi:hypothetical protein